MLPAPGDQPYDSSMSESVSFDRFDDIDAQAEQLVGFEQHYQQIEPGHYAGAFLTHEIADLSIAIEQTNRALYQMGAGPSGQLSAVFLLDEGDRPSRVNGQEFSTDDVLLVTEGGSYETVITAGAVPAVLSLPAMSSTLDPVADYEVGSVRQARDAGLATSLRLLVRASVPGFTAPWSARTGSVADTRTQQAGQALMTRLRCRVFEGGVPSHGTFRWARSILVQDIAADISVAELARAVGVSRRTLDASFRASVGVSPARFRKLLRLNHARRLIEGGHHSVASAASVSGLHHLGRFSRDYRMLFGELPSSTRSRMR